MPKYVTAPLKVDKADYSTSADNPFQRIYCLAALPCIYHHRNRRSSKSATRETLIREKSGTTNPLQHYIEQAHHPTQQNRRYDMMGQVVNNRGHIKTNHPPSEVCVRSAVLATGTRSSQMRGGHFYTTPMFSVRTPNIVYPSPSPPSSAPCTRRRYDAIHGALAGAATEAPV